MPIRKIRFEQNCIPGTHVSGRLFPETVSIQHAQNDSDNHRTEREFLYELHVTYIKGTLMKTGLSTKPREAYCFFSRST